jgi:hypothetical protein
MLQLDNLAQIAEDLRKLGLEVYHDFIYGPRGCLEGLDVGEDFFPLWELALPENRESLERLDFSAMKARRGQNWPLAPAGH